MKHILCFGDSNTWGSIPDSLGRFPRDVRCPGAMARLLGEEYEVAEAGLGGRTTVFEVPGYAQRAGRDFLLVEMESAGPLDLVIILLGTNDVRLAQIAAPEIVAGTEELVTIAQGALDLGPDPAAQGAPRVLLVTPFLVGPWSAEDLQASPNAPALSRELAALYGEVAVRRGCGHADLGPVVSASAQDPWHLDAESHAAVATFLSGVVTRMLT